MGDIREKYVNIDMCGRGCTSGKWEEWPVLREECREVLKTLESMDKQIKMLCQIAKSCCFCAKPFETLAELRKHSESCEKHPLYEDAARYRDLCE